ncbi:MAG TPA: hypothetical protein VIY49_32040, partial [Bryobacteraceae bacterium]
WTAETHKRVSLHYIAFFKSGYWEHVTCPHRKSKKSQNRRSRDELGLATLADRASLLSPHIGIYPDGDPDWVLTLENKILPIKGVALVGPLPTEYRSNWWLRQA